MLLSSFLKISSKYRRLLAAEKERLVDFFIVAQKRNSWLISS